MKQGLRTIHERNRRESGNTILSILIGMALLISAVSAAMMGMKNITDSRKNLAASAATKDIENTIVSAIAEKYKTYVTGLCTDTSDITPSIQVGSFATLDRRTIPGLATIFTPTKVASHLTRCASKQFTLGSGRYYSCYRVSINNSFASRSSKESFASNRGAFVEVLMNIKDLRTDSYVSCASLPTDSLKTKIDTSKGPTGYGLEIYYSLNWIMKVHKDYIPKNRVGTINVGL